MKTAQILAARTRRERAPTTRDLRLRTILVPTDFSKPSLKALKYADALAKNFRAALHLINVFDVQVEPPSVTPLYAIDPEIEHRRGRRLRGLAREYAPRLPGARCHVRVGLAFDEVCRAAERLDADLIVTATQGYTGMQHLLFGSTAERIVRHAPCPVLVVREKEHDFVSGNGVGPATRRIAFRLRRILVATDFSEQSRIALRYAIAFAKRFGAKLTLLHVLHTPYYVTNPDTVTVDYGKLLDSIRGNARRDMNEFVRSTAFHGVPFSTHIEEGHPGDLIVEQAAKSGADLIVNGTHGRTGLRHVLLGSIAEYVVRHGKCPVLVVPRPGSANSAARNRVTTRLSF